MAIKEKRRSSEAGEEIRRADRDQPQVQALQALKIKKFVGVTYFTGKINDMFSTYFKDAGFDVMAMEGIPVAFEDVGRLASQEVYAHTKKAFLKHPGAEAIYMLGSGWRTLDIIRLLEEDLQVPVVHPSRRASGRSSGSVHQPARVSAGCSKDAAAAGPAGR
jgi:maleate cis-trans isomerase